MMCARIILLCSLYTSVFSLYFFQQSKQSIRSFIYLITHEFDNRERILFSGPEGKLLNPGDLKCNVHALKCMFAVIFSVVDGMFLSVVTIFNICPTTSVR